jgi:ketosteroid isomerase-like protein
MQTARSTKEDAMLTPGIAEAIRKLDGEFMDAGNTGNAAALVSAFYANDAVLMPPNHPMVEGAAVIEKFWRGLFDAGLRRVTLETTRVEAAADLAYGRGRYRLELAPAGTAPVEDAGKYVVVYRPDGGGRWRAVVDIFNSDLHAR